MTAGIGTDAGGRAAALVEELTQLPVQHLVAARLLAMLDGESPEAGELGKLIAADPALSAQVIRLANSAAYGLRNKTGSASRAVMVLGFGTVRALAAGAAFGLFGEKGKAAPDGFWPHSVATAAAATVVARRVGCSAGEAFSAGMLHDLGTALLFRHAPRRYDAAARQAVTRPDELLELETVELGMTHPEVGGAVLAAWHFTPEFVEAVANHHGPFEGTCLLTRVVAAGEALAQCHDDGGSAEPSLFLGEALALVGLSPAHAETLLEQVRAEIDSLAGFLTETG